MRFKITTAAAGLAIIGLAGPVGSQEAIPLKEAKLIIEYNTTDDDIGFQGFIDSEGWQNLVVYGPEGDAVLRFEGLGTLGNHGLTELFFETVEPAADEMSMQEVLLVLPEGEYIIEGTATEAGEALGTTRGVAQLTHNIPAGPRLLSPAENAVVAADDLLVSWSPVTETIDGRDVEIIAYQLIIEVDEDPHPMMIGKIGLSMYLPATVTQITVPRGFLTRATSYLWEVLAIEESGNQTLSSGAFSTE